MVETKVIIGGSLEEDAAAFLDAWRRVEAGETVSETALAFESWEALASVMTGERYRLMRHVHAHPEPSVSAWRVRSAASIAACTPMSPPLRR
jgi:predicted transcriptional regulator